MGNLKLFLPARPISHLICNAAVYLVTRTRTLALARTLTRALTNPQPQP